MTLTGSEKLAWARAAGVEIATIDRWLAGDTLEPELAARLVRVRRALFGGPPAPASSGPPQALGLSSLPELK